MNKIKKISPVICRSIFFLLFFSLPSFYSCTHNFYLNRTNLSVTQQLIKELNDKGKKSSSIIYLKNGGIFKADNLQVRNDSLYFQAEKFNPTQIDTLKDNNPKTEHFRLPINEIKKVQFTSVLKGGRDGIFVGLGTGLATGFLLGYYQPLDSEDPPSRELIAYFDSIIGGIAGAVIGFSVGLILRKKEVYYFEKQRISK